MPETLFIKDFSAGWCPSDDAVNGRPNACLQMDNLELDTNGALALIGGTFIKQSGFTAPAHTLFSRYINGTRHDYSALTDGSVWRDGSSIIAGGDSKNAAFSTAFNYTLICSGNARYKDSGTVIVPLGVGTPTAAPIITNPAQTPFVAIGSLVTDTVTAIGSSIVVTGPPAYLQLTTDVFGVGVVQSFGLSGTPIDTTMLTGASSDVGTSLDSDMVIIHGYTPSVYGVSLQFDILLQPPDSGGDQVSDYYTFKISDLSTLVFDSFSGVFTATLLRSNFVRVGTDNTKSWNTTYGYRITVVGGAGQVINFLQQNAGLAISLSFQGGSNAQNGVYQFAQVNVNNTGSYVALSGFGPVSNPVTLTNSQVELTLQAPSDAQVNEVWVFAQSTGGTNNIGLSSQLNAWFRVARLTTNFTTPFFITQGDTFTLALDITFNINLVSISSASITDKIYDIVGPIEGRWFYFTANFMYPSDINNPDLVDVSLAIRTCGSASELFMWARAISASVVNVGTSIDVYLLTGTFVTLPDGTIDVYYQRLGVTQFPPITYDAVSYAGSVYYLANDGWRTVAATSFGSTYSGSNNALLVAPNTDRLYRGDTCYGYAPPNLKIAPGSVRFPVTIAKNKLWCFITGTQRCEVYDFIRQYWRTFNYGFGVDVDAVTSTQDGQVLAFYNTGHLREIGIPSSKLIDGTTNQSYSLLLTYKDNGKPRQRKDTYTFRTRCYTGSVGDFNIAITDEDQNTLFIGGNIVSIVSTSEQVVDLSLPYSASGQPLSKSYQLQVTGTSSDFLLEDMSIDYDPRPVPLSFLKIQPSNFGVASKKRVRTWPVVIDTRGNNVMMIPQVDGTSQPSTILNTHHKTTTYYFFVTDVFGIDYGFTLYDPTGLMEVWDVVPPTIVQQLPVPCQFDQVGPQELQRLGKVIQIGVRVLPFGSSIPFNIYFADSSTWTGSFPTVSGIEDTYYIDIPKGRHGRIMRVELGPTNFNFHRYYMKFKIAQSGGQENTELQWVTIPQQGMI